MTVGELNGLLHTLCEDRYPEDRIEHGDPEARVRGVLLTWMPSPAALDRAGAEGLNTVIIHEDFLFGPSAAEAALVSDAERASWPANSARLARVRRHDLAVIRCHRTLDAWGIPEVWYRDVLGLGEPVIARGVRGYRFVQVYEIEAVPARVLVARFKERLGLSVVRGGLRDPERRIRRIGAVWGGVGTSSNFYTTAQTLAEGVDMVVGGETDERAAYFFREAGVDVVDLGHQRSEIDGIALLAPWLRERSGVPVAVHREETPLGFH